MTKTKTLTTAQRRKVEARIKKLDAKIEPLQNRHDALLEQCVDDVRELGDDLTCDVEDLTDVEYMAESLRLAAARLEKRVPKLAKLDDRVQRLIGDVDRLEALLGESDDE